MKLEEDNRTNRLEESLQLFGEVLGLPASAHSLDPHFFYH